MSILKRGDKVNYVGGGMVVDMDDNDNPIQETFSPINNTFIWAILNVNGGNNYIIEHPKGLDRDFFLQANGLPEGTEPISSKALKEGVKYIFAVDEQLELVEAYGSESTTTEEPKTESEEEVSDEETILDDVEKEVEEEAKAEETVEVEKKELKFTKEEISGQIPSLSLEQYIKKPIIVRAAQIDSPFSVETINGTVVPAPAGDYLMIRNENDLYPSNKAAFDATYEPLDTLKSINLFGKDIAIAQEVADYITELQNTNEKLRDEVLEYNNPAKNIDPNKSAEKQEVGDNGVSATPKSVAKKAPKKKTKDSDPKK